MALNGYYNDNDLFAYLMSPAEISAANNQERLFYDEEQRRNVIPEIFKAKPMHTFVRTSGDSLIEKYANLFYNNRTGDDYKDYKLQKELDRRYFEEKNSSGHGQKTNTETSDRINEESWRNDNLSKEERQYSITDNTGKELTQGQLEFFNDSKARDENGSLVMVYHTTTNNTSQFNEFNPVGTPGYKYGNTVVNFYTDSKEMSGSYADQEYRTADTSTLKTQEEVLNWIEENKDNEDVLSTDITYKIIPQANGKIGLMYYTIGQRRGLDVGGTKERMFVVGKNLDENILYVCTGEENDYLVTTSCIVNELNILNDSKIEKCFAKFRYRQEDIPVEVDWTNKEEITVKYPQGVKRVTPGQACVLYSDTGEVIAGGIIKEVRKNNEKLWYL